MKKKGFRLLIISIVLVVLLVVVLCTTTLMRLRDLSVDYVSSFVLFNDDTKDEIIEKSGFKYSENLLFTKMDTYMENIEAGVPYAKVHNIERKFPNKAIIHVEERTPVIKIHDSTFIGQYSVYDKDLKVLHVANYTNLYKESGEDSVPVLKLDSSLNKEIDLSLKAGEFLDDELLKSWVVAIADGTYEYNATSTTIMSDIVIEKSGGYVVFTISFDNSEIVATITGDDNLQDKIYKAVKTFSELSGKYSNYSISVNNDGTIFAHES